MKNKKIKFDAEELVRSVEEVRDHVMGRRKLTLRTTRLKLHLRSEDRGRSEPGA